MKAPITLHIEATETYPDIDVEVHDGTDFQPGQAVPVVTLAAYNELKEKGTEFLAAQDALNEFQRPKSAFGHPRVLKHTDAEVIRYRIARQALEE